MSPLGCAFFVEKRLKRVLIFPTPTFRSARDGRGGDPHSSDFAQHITDDRGASAQSSESAHHTFPAQASAGDVIHALTTAYSQARPVALGARGNPGLTMSIDVCVHYDDLEPQLDEGRKVMLDAVIQKIFIIEGALVSEDDNAYPLISRSVPPMPARDHANRRYFLDKPLREIDITGLNYLLTRKHVNSEGRKNPYCLENEAAVAAAKGLVEVRNTICHTNFEIKQEFAANGSVQMWSMLIAVYTNVLLKSQVGGIFSQNLANAKFARGSQQQVYPRPEHNPHQHALKQYPQSPHTKGSTQYDDPHVNLSAHEQTHPNTVTSSESTRFSAVATLGESSTTTEAHLSVPIRMQWETNGQTKPGNPTPQKSKPQNRMPPPQRYIARHIGKWFPNSAFHIGIWGVVKFTQCSFCKSVGHHKFECPALFFSTFNICMAGFDQRGMRLHGYWHDGDQRKGPNQEIAKFWVEHAFAPGEDELQGMEDHYGLLSEPPRPGKLLWDGWADNSSRPHAFRHLRSESSTCESVPEPLTKRARPNTDLSSGATQKSASAARPMRDSGNAFPNSADLIGKSFGMKKSSKCKKCYEVGHDFFECPLRFYEKTGHCMPGIDAGGNRLPHYWHGADELLGPSPAIASAWLAHTWQTGDLMNENKHHGKMGIPSCAGKTLWESWARGAYPTR